MSALDLERGTMTARVQVVRRAGGRDGLAGRHASSTSPARPTGAVGAVDTTSLTVLGASSPAARPRVDCGDAGRAHALRHLRERRVHLGRGCRGRRGERRHPADDARHHGHAAAADGRRAVAGRLDRCSSPTDARRVVSAIDVATRTAGADDSHVGARPWGIAISADGTAALHGERSVRRRIVHRRGGGCGRAQDSASAAVPGASPCGRQIADVGIRPARARRPRRESPPREPGMRASFGGFTLDAETRQLAQGSRVLHLSPKAFALLLLLAGAPAGGGAKGRDRQPDLAGRDRLGHEPRWAGEGDPSRPRRRPGAAGLHPDGPQRRVRVRRRGWTATPSATCRATRRLLSVLAGVGRSHLLPGAWRERHRARPTLRRLARRLRRIPPPRPDHRRRNGGHDRGPREPKRHGRRPSLVTTARRLEDGDSIRVGATTLTFRQWSEERAPRTEAARAPQLTRAPFAQQAGRRALRQQARLKAGTTRQQARLKAGTTTTGPPEGGHYEAGRARRVSVGGRHGIGGVLESAAMRALAAGLACLVMAGPPLRGRPPEHHLHHDRRSRRARDRRVRVARQPDAEPRSACARGRAAHERVRDQLDLHAEPRGDPDRPVLAPQRRHRCSTASTARG